MKRCQPLPLSESVNQSSSGHKVLVRLGNTEQQTSFHEARSESSPHKHHRVTSASKVLPLSSLGIWITACYCTGAGSHPVRRTVVIPLTVTLVLFLSVPGKWMEQVNGGLLSVATSIFCTQSTWEASNKGGKEEVKIPDAVCGTLKFFLGNLNNLWPYSQTSIKPLLGDFSRLHRRIGNQSGAVLHRFIHCAHTGWVCRRWQHLLWPTTLSSR